MAVRIDVEYEGDLHCSAIHEPSGDRIPTDAPVDNHGRGEHFSPTDLVAASIGTCMLTIMGIAAEKHQIDLRGASAVLHKEMSAVPRRHISKLSIEITVPRLQNDKSRRIVEAAARGCPVVASLGADTQVDLSFKYPD